MNCSILCTTFYLLFVVANTHAQTLLLEGNLDDWQLEIKKGKTQYLPIMDMEQGVVIRAQSMNSASAYVYDHTVNLLKTPIIKWQWTAQQLPSALVVGEDGIERTQAFDETKLSGDDFVLRVSVGLKPLFSAAKTLHYVWSSQQPIGSHWAIDEHTRVLVISGEAQTSMKWQTQMRHVQKDWLAVFDEKIQSLDFVSFMTDTDNINGQAIGYYGDMQMLAGQSLASE